MKHYIEEEMTSSKETTQSFERQTLIFDMSIAMNSTTVEEMK